MIEKCLTSLIVVIAFVSSSFTPIVGEDVVTIKPATALETLELAFSKQQAVIDSLTRELEITHQSYNGSLCVKAGVDQTMTPQFAKALAEYTGPQVLIPSLFRPHSHRLSKTNSKSKHCQGKAADWSLDRKVIKWLESEEGLCWLETNNLRYFIEFPSATRTYKKYKKRYNKVRVVSWATAPHIHLEQWKNT